jgi:hypothetical protein
MLARVWTMDIKRLWLENVIQKQMFRYAKGEMAEETSRRLDLSLSIPRGRGNAVTCVGPTAPAENKTAEVMNDEGNGESTVCP